MQSSDPWCISTPIFFHMYSSEHVAEATYPHARPYGGKKAVLANLNIKA